MLTIIVVAVAATLVISVLVTALIMTFRQKKIDAENERKIGTAEERARKIIDDAVRAADESKREKLLEVKEESLKARNELEKK